jgi:hypothetical protein
MPAMHDRTVFGIDFTSAPRRAKPIRVAAGRRHGAVIRLEGVIALASLDAFSIWLAQPGPWVAGFDLPFGLPRELVERLSWPTDYAALMTHYAGLDRADIRDRFKAFCDARPAGGKFAHRACDGPAGASPSMKWVNPPVAWMLHAGVPRLIAAGVHLAGHLTGDRAGDESRVALEAYPGLLARELIGRRSYKSDTKAAQTPERLIARLGLVDALEQGRTKLGLRLKLSHAQRDELVADASGDSLDAVLALLQAAWAAEQPRYGWPEGVDPLEGWIAGA